MTDFERAKYNVHVDPEYREWRREQKTRVFEVAVIIPLEAKAVGGRIGEFLDQHPLARSSSGKGSPRGFEIVFGSTCENDILEALVTFAV